MIAIYCQFLVMSFRFGLTLLPFVQNIATVYQLKKQGPGGYETLKHRLDATAKIMEYLGPMLPGWGEAEDNNTMGTHVFTVKK